MMLFNVTYDIVTPESAAEGDAAERGFIAEGVPLREALELVQETESSACERQGVDASDSNVGAARWLTVYNGPNFRTGDAESRSLHFPESLSAPSRVRIARLLRCYGVA
jgi:hypothetical protein